MNSALYIGRVVHERSFPARHRLAYGVWYLLVDLDELDALDRGVPGLAVNRWAPVSFHEADHGPRDGSPLRPWIEARLADAGVDLDGGSVRLLTFPRVLGYVFNPISIWFCAGPGGDLRAILYEVSNTFGERHGYLVPVGPGEVEGDARGRRLRTAFDKRLYVSPFIDMAATYDVSTRLPDDRASVVMRETAAGGRVLVASLAARRRPLTGRTLAGAMLRFPLVTVKVIGGIHWEALRLWRKGAPFRRRGAPPADPITIVRDGSSRARRASVASPPVPSAVPATGDTLGG